MQSFSSLREGISTAASFKYKGKEAVNENLGISTTLGQVVESQVKDFGFFSHILRFFKEKKKGKEGECFLTIVI